MTQADFLTAVQDYIGDKGALRSSLIKRIANRKMKELFRKFKVRWALTKGSITVTDGTSDYNLPEDWYKPYITTERENDNVIQHCTLKEIKNDYPDPSDITEAVPTHYAPIGISNVQAQPTAASKIAMVSTSASDTGTMSIYGKVGGILKLETKALTGASSVDSANTYDADGLVYISSGTALVGVVTCTSNSAAVTNLTLQIGEKFKESYRCRMFPTPDDTYTVYFWYYRMAKEISNNSDLIMIPTAYNDWLPYITAAEILKIDGAKDANDYFKLAQMVFNQMVSDEVLEEDENWTDWIMDYPKDVKF